MGVFKKRKPCEQCGKEIKRGQRRFCSIECTAKSREGIYRRVNNYTCENCGESFRPKVLDRTTYCSRDCYFEAKTKRKEERIEHKERAKIRQCKICGASFRQTLTEVYCGDECRKEKASRDALRSNKIKMLSKTTKIRSCKECNEPFISEYGDKKRAYCSITCAHRYMSRDGKATRRARKKGNKYESFSPYIVFNRDHWTCQLCHIKTPRKLRGTNDDHAPELDHIMSLAEGGEHSMRNTQCLCRRCNQNKGATTKGQLRMFG